MIKRAPEAAMTVIDFERSLHEQFRFLRRDQEWVEYWYSIIKKLRYSSGIFFDRWNLR